MVVALPFTPVDSFGLQKKQAWHWGCPEYLLGTGSETVVIADF